MKQHSTRFLEYVNAAKKRINKLSPETLKNKLNQEESFFLIDVREDSEWLTGHILKAMHISKGVIERDIEKLIPDTDNELVLYCSGGFRSALVADSLQNMGYTKVLSLQSGLQGWIDEGNSLIKEDAL